MKCGSLATPQSITLRFLCVGLLSPPLATLTLITLSSGHLPDFSTVRSPSSFCTLLAFCGKILYSVIQ